MILIYLITAILLKPLPAIGISTYSNKKDPIECKWQIKVVSPTGRIATAFGL